MHRRNFLIPLLIITILLLLLSACSKKLKHRDDILLQPSEETSAPDHAMPYVEFQDEHGKTVHISEFIDKPFFLYETAADSSFTEEIAAQINSSAQESGKDCQYILVFAGQKDAVLRSDAYLSIQRTYVNVLFDPESEAAGVLSGGTLPFACFVDKDGFISAESMGPVDSEELSFGIRLIKNRNS